MLFKVCQEREGKEGGSHRVQKKFSENHSLQNSQQNLDNRIDIELRIVSNNVIVLFYDFFD